MVGFLALHHTADGPNVMVLLEWDKSHSISFRSRYGLPAVLLRGNSHDL